MLRPPVKPIEYVIVADGRVTVAYRHRSDAVLSARELVKRRKEQGRTGTVLIHKREIGTGRWIDTPTHA